MEDKNKPAPTKPQKERIPLPPPGLQRQPGVTDGLITLRHPSPLSPADVSSAPRHLHQSLPCAAIHQRSLCIAMKTVLRWIIWLIILVTLFPGGILSQRVSVLINQRATLIRNASSCENGKWVKSYPTKATIATCQKHTCVIEEDFLEKMELEETSNNLVFKSVKYNDWGTYEFICNGKDPIRLDSPTWIRLDVLVPQNKTARPMSNITLSCYATNPNDVTWLHYDKTILNCTGKGCTLGEGYESRASLNEGCFEDGDCSLSLTAVSEMDAGLYHCFAEDESPKGSARAHMLHVNEDPSSPEGNQTENNGWCYTAITLFFISLGLAWALYKKEERAPSKAANQSTSTTASHTPNENEPSENHPMLESITTQPDDNTTQIITQPVQESETSPKSSSTVPF